MESDNVNDSDFDNVQQLFAPVNSKSDKQSNCWIVT